MHRSPRRTEAFVRSPARVRSAHDTPGSRLRDAPVGLNHLKEEKDGDTTGDEPRFRPPEHDTDEQTHAHILGDEVPLDRADPPEQHYESQNMERRASKQGKKETSSGFTQAGGLDRHRDRQNHCEQNRPHAEAAQRNDLMSDSPGNRSLVGKRCPEGYADPVRPTTSSPTR